MGRNWLHTAWGSANIFRPLPLPLALEPQPLVGAVLKRPAVVPPVAIRTASETAPKLDWPNSWPEPSRTRSGKPLATVRMGATCQPPTIRFNQPVLEWNGRL